MKKKEIEKETIPTVDFEELKNMTTGIDTSFWLLTLLALIMADTPKEDNKTTINIYTGSDK